MKRKSFAILITVLAVACLAVAILYNASQINLYNKKAAQDIAARGNAATKKPQPPTVGVLQVQAASYQALVKGYGEVAPHYAITYSAEVSGRVDAVMAKFATGKRLKKGDILAKLDNSLYQQTLVKAKADLAEAKLALLEEQRTAKQARVEWQNSGLDGEPDSPLVLHEPQLAAQQALFENAQYSVIKAQQDLAKTIIKVPFDALIVERHIQPGSYLQAGAAVALLYSVDRVEIEIPLSAKQWRNLPQLSNKQLSKSAAKKWPVSLHSADGNTSWQGYVSRVEQHLDATSRQRSLIVAVDRPFEQPAPLFPGSFVQAEIQGAMLNNLWKLPASAISQQGDIWYITKDNLLNKVAVDKVFANADSVYIRAIAELPSLKIIKRPLSSYMVGMRIAPKVEG